MNVYERVVHAIMDVANRVKKRKYSDDPADAIANGGRVSKSDAKLSDVADESERDSDS